MNNRTEVLEKYLLSNIKPIYKAFDKAHDERHFDEVYNFIKKNLDCFILSDSEIDIMLAAAAFHDVGRLISDSKHEEYSAIAVKENIFIKNYFSSSDIDRIAEIISNHRHKIVTDDPMSNFLKDADKAAYLKKERALYRIIGYQLDHYERLYKLYESEMTNNKENNLIIMATKELIRKPLHYYPKTLEMQEKYGNIDWSYTDNDISNMINKITKNLN